MKKKKKKKKRKENHTKILQDTLDFVFNDLETVDYDNDTKLDDIEDLETVVYNDISITDLIPIKKLETIKEEYDEEHRLQIIKTVNYAAMSNGDADDVKFIQKTPLHHRQKLKCLSKNNLIRNQTDKKNNFPQILPQKKLIQKNENQSKDIVNI